MTLPEPGGDRSVAVVERDGEQVAALVYDRSLDDDPELVEAVGGAATIALENRQLHAEAEARLAELQASGERIIAAGRRRAPPHRAQPARRRAAAAGHPRDAALADPAPDPRRPRRRRAARHVRERRAGASLEELRELARGIHPAALDQGLETALEALAMRSRGAHGVVETRPPLPEPVEFAAYFVASEALANTAKYARRTGGDGAA